MTRRSLALLLCLFCASVVWAPTGSAQPAPEEADPSARVASAAPDAPAPVNPAPAIPTNNAASLRQPPPRPPASEANARAAAFLAAVAADDADDALAFFLPRDAFRLIKGVANPDRFFDRLVRHFRADVHSLHEAHPELAQAEFVRIELSRRRGWVLPRQEANRLPYWSVRHSRLVYRVGGRERSFELRTLITWDDHWFLSHLGEFH